MRVLIVEDELPARKMLESLIHEIRPQWEVVAGLDSVASTIKWFQNNPEPDVLFLDVQLSDGVSFKIFDQINPSCFIIFTTAYDEYAIQAFKVNSVDYLLKPIKGSELEGAIEKLEHLLKRENQAETPIDYAQMAKAIGQSGKQYRKRFLINSGDRFYTLNTSDVAYFYSQQKITFAVTFNGEEKVVDFSLEKLHEQLDPELFFRANRQTILHIDAIRRIENYFYGKLLVKTQPATHERLIVSREKAILFKQWLDR